MNPFDRSTTKEFGPVTPAGITYRRRMRVINARRRSVSAKPGEAGAPEAKSLAQPLGAGQLIEHLAERGVQ
jgi:hypothetical protein